MTLTLAGVDGLTTFISVEPYSRTRAAPETPRNVDNGAGGSGKVGGGGGGTQGREQGRELPYDQMTVEQKVAKCCRDFNSAKGCTSRRCGLKHWCSAVDRVTKRVCWNRRHALPEHK